MTEHTNTLNLPYPDGSDGPDGAGGISALALAIEAYFGRSYQGFSTASNQAYVPGSALVLDRLGPLRVLNFSIQNNFDVEIGSGFLQVPSADAPGSRVSGGGFVITTAGRSVASYSLQADRSVVLAAGPGGSGNTHEGTLLWFV